MTIDYKALAEKLNTLSERLVDSEEHAVEAAIPPIAEEAAEALCTVVSLLEETADAPAMWVQSNHLNWAGKQPFMARCAPTQLHPDFVPVYLHPAPQPQPEPTSKGKPGFMQQIENSRKNVKAWPQWMQDATVESAATMPKFPTSQAWRQPVSKPTEAQIEAAAKYLCQKFVYRNDGYTFDSAWELFAYNFRRDGQDLLRAVLAAKEQPK